MRKLLHAVVLGLIGAGIVHILVLLMVPEFSERDAWSRLAMESDLYKVIRLEPEPGGAPVVKSVDPLFQAVACRFDLEDGIVQVTAPGGVPFWSVSIYDRNGHNIYSFNDRSASDAALNAAVLTPAQMIELRKEPSGQFEGAVFVEADIGEGIAVIRSFVPDESWKPAAMRFFERSACTLRQF